jgi:hypothetical protein
MFLPCTCSIIRCTSATVPVNAMRPLPACNCSAHTEIKLPLRAALHLLMCTTSSEKVACSATCSSTRPQSSAGRDGILLKNNAATLREGGGSAPALVLVLLPLLTLDMSGCSWVAQPVCPQTNQVTHYTCITHALKKRAGVSAKL